MTQEQLIALAFFVFVATVTPGPNNLMLMASGANFGVRRTVPHMLGISFGMFTMVGLVGVGLIRVFEIWPVTGIVLKVVGVVYLLYLAVKIATAAPLETESGTEVEPRPFSFVQAALFQLVNPKAWTIMVTALSVYAPARELGSVFLVAAAFVLIGLPSISLWAAFGERLRGFLSAPLRLRYFNIAVAALLVASLYPIVTA